MIWGDIIEMWMKKGKTLLRVTAFLVVFAVCFFVVQSAFGVDQLGAYLHNRGFLHEKAGSLDGVYIGASNVHAYWQPLVGWNEYGISVYDYSFDGMPVGAVRYLLEAARTRHPDALFIININQFRNRENQGTSDVVAKLHRSLDYMPISITKARVVSGLARSFSLTFPEQLELMLPIIPFHSRWNELDGWALGAETTDYKSSRSNRDFLMDQKDYSRKYTIIDDRQDREEIITTAFDELMDYIDSSGARVLFVKVPQSMIKSKQKYLNTIEDMVLERGYPCLDLHENIDSTYIDPKWDFYNGNHTNVHGSLKYTHSLGAYLVEHYGFADKRGTPGWESWDEAGERYYKLLSSYALPFELENEPRVKLDAPELGKAEADGQTITVSWSSSEGAGGYQIYRKSAEDGNRWVLAGETDNETFTWRDSDRKPSTEYTYTVVPCRREGDGWRYGSFDIHGVSAKTAADKAAKEKAAEPDGEEESEEDEE